MLTARARLRPGFFFAALAALILAGCPQSVPAKPQPPPPPAQVLWYTPDWNDPAAFDPVKLQAVGVTGVLATHPVAPFEPQMGPLTLDWLRQQGAAIKARSGSLQVWWTWSAIRHESNEYPQRTLCDPQDQAARTQLLNNYASIGRVAREMGFVGVALDTENFSGTGLTWPDEPGSRQLGADLATAIRQNYPACRLAAFGPLINVTPGFKKVWRGFNEQAKDGVFFDEGLHGASGMNPKDVRQVLARCGDITGARYPAASWYASTKAPNVPQWFQAAVPQLQAAARISPYVMVYRDGTMQPPEWDALGRTLRALPQ